MADYTFGKETTVPPDRSAAEVMKYLGMMGASKVQTEFDPKTGSMTGMRFSVIFPDSDQELHYKMPIRSKEVADKWKAEKKKKARRKLPDGWEEKVEQQALWTAWRIALEWLKIQLTFVQCGARDAKEVFMSDMIVNNEGETLGQLFLEGRLPKLLTAGPQE